MSGPGRRLVAHHEAGHACVAASLGMVVDRVTVGDGGGRTELRPGQPCTRLADMVQTLAGVVATERFCALHGLALPPAPADDLERFRAHLGAFGDDHGAQAVEVRRITAAVVGNLWPAIERVAALLDEQGELGGDQLGSVRPTEVVLA